MRALKAIFLIVGIPLFYYGLEFFSASAFGGAGDGVFYFTDAVTAPFTNFSATGHGDFIRSFGIILWPAVSVLLALRRLRGCQYAAGIILIIHYCGVTKLGFDYSWSYAVGKTWSVEPGVLSVFVAAYVISQIFMWWLLISKRLLPNKSPEPGGANF